MAANHVEIKAACREMLRGTASGTFLTFTQQLEHKNGHVFLLLDIDVTCKATPQIVGMLRESVERLGRTLSQKSHLQHRFEQILQTINQELADIQTSGRAGTQVHAALGVLRDDAFILSLTGTVHAFFLRKTAKQRFRVFDLTQTVRTEVGKTDQSKLFQVVLEGDLQADDVLFVASKDVHTILSVEDIHPLLTTLPPASSLETIEQYLPSKARLAIVLFQMKQEKSVITGFGAHTTSKSSMNALLQTEQQTASMLELEKPHVQQTFLQLIRLVKSGNTIERKEFARRVLERLWRLTKLLAAQILHVVSSIAVSLYSLLLVLITRGGKRKQALANIRHAWKRTIGFATTHLHGSRLGSRAFLLTGLICVVLLGATGVSLRIRSTRQAETAQFADTLRVFQAHQDAASASLIYGDELAARRELQAASELLDALQTTQPERLAQLAELRAQVETGLNATRRILPVSPSSTAVVNNVVVSGTGSRVFFRDGSTAQFTDGVLSASASTGTSLSNPLLTSYQDRAISIQEQALVEFDPATQTWSTVGINRIENELTEVRDLAHYGERLYLLTPQGLYRHQRVENGEYGPGTSWLVDPVDLSNATTLAIDGTVWLGTPTTLRHFDQGREVGADTSSIDPPLGNIQDMWTDATSPYLFILDTQHHRVLLYDKTTQTLAGQFIDRLFEGVFSLYVDPAQETLTLYAPTTIFTFSYASPSSP